MVKEEVWQSFVLCIFSSERLARPGDLRIVLELVPNLHSGSGHKSFWVKCSIPIDGWMRVVFISVMWGLPRAGREDAVPVQVQIDAGGFILCTFASARERCLSMTTLLYTHLAWLAKLTTTN
jgi:hypothetical protein